jgi:hypothetical protein
MRWTVLKRVPQATSWRSQLCYASKSSWWSAQPGWLSPYSYLELSGRGLDALPGLIVPHHRPWCVADMQPLFLDACEDISYLHTVHGFLPEACGFLPGSLGPAWVGAMADVRIPLSSHYRSH